jgi:hypothetical protein
VAPAGRPALKGTSYFSYVKWLAKKKTVDYLSGIQSDDKILFFNPKYVLMKQELDIRPIPTGKVLFRLALVGCLLLACVYGFLMLFNTALEAMK